MDGAIGCYREVIRLDPKDANAHWYLGIVQDRKGDADGAVAAFREALRLTPNHHAILGDLARVRAVGPDGVRAGKEAVKLATQACERTGWKNPGFIDTLAAAYAEAGDFDKALEYQKKAADLAAGTKELEADIRSRIGLYERKKPYRDPKYTRRELAPPPRPVGNSPTPGEHP